MKKIIGLIAFLFVISTSYAQQVLLSQDVLKDTIVPRKGPNRQNFNHLYVGYGLIFGDEPGTLKTEQPGTYDFRAGFRFKRRLSQTFALGYDLAYVKNGFNLKTSLHNKEKIILNKAELGLYLRINYGRRGDRVGNFIDLGGAGGWVFKSSYLTIDKNPAAVPAKKMVNKFTGLKDTEDLSYSALARIGFGRYVIYGEYRLSEVFTSSASGLPVVTAGIQIGLHK